MCGILAILNSHLSQRELRQKALLLSRRLRHRGPDWNGTETQLLEDGTSRALSHERLSIVNPTSGAQPFVDESGDVVVTVNGEIYNYKQLMNNLPEDVRATLMIKSDCVCIPYLYAQMGEDLVPLLDGIFAFVLSDRKTGLFFAARDPMGICPLYAGYSQEGSTYFASEMKALAECPRVEIIPPGHVFSSVRGLYRYYRPDWWELTSPIPTAKVELDTIKNALIAAVQKRLMCDVPFGVLLSGGLDSSLIASIAHKLIKEGSSSGEFSLSELHSFSVGLAGSPDLSAARVAADFIGTNHHEFTFNIQDGLDSLKDVVYHLETYDVTTIRAATPMYFLSRSIKAVGVKMVLSGEGADEMFGGYLYFHKAPNREEFHRETQRKLQALHQYDVLRANKAPMAWGLEVRVPFLDKEFLNVGMSVDPADKMCIAGKRIEKWILREAFKGYLPDEILWRQKEQFSDGVGYGWIDNLRAHANNVITDNQMALAPKIFFHNSPTTKEGFLYRSYFLDYFPSESAAGTVPGGPSIACSTAAAIAWDASFKENADQSGRSVLGVHVSDNSPPVAAR